MVSWKLEKTVTAAENNLVENILAVTQRLADTETTPSAMTPMSLAVRTASLPPQAQSVARALAFVMWKRHAPAPQAPVPQTNICRTDKIVATEVD